MRQKSYNFIITAWYQGQSIWKCSSTSRPLCLRLSRLPFSLSAYLSVSVCLFICLSLGPRFCETNRKTYYFSSRLWRHSQPVGCVRTQAAPEAETDRLPGWEGAGSLSSRWIEEGASFEGKRLFWEKYGKTLHTKRQGQAPPTQGSREATPLKGIEEVDSFEGQKQVPIHKGLQTVLLLPCRDKRPLTLTSSLPP